MRYLIWDFDDTLGYREGGKWLTTLSELVEQALPELGVTYEQLKPHLRVAYPWHTPEWPHLELQTAEAWWEMMTPILQRALMGVGVPEEPAYRLARQFPARYTDLSRWRLFPDTLPALTQLSSQGYRHVLLTNHVPELPEIIGHLGLTEHLVAVFNSAQTGYEKPHPQAFRQVLDFIGAADDVWMIGDNPKADIAGAEALGIPGILVRNTHPDVRYCCSNLAQVMEIIEGLKVSKQGRSAHDLSTR
ncbi:MAG: HAD family hydrolase [Armatimonadota bacterium]